MTGAKPDRDPLLRRLATRAAGVATRTTAAVTGAATALVTRFRSHRRRRREMHHSSSDDASPTPAPTTAASAPARTVTRRSVSALEVDGAVTTALRVRPDPSDATTVGDVVGSGRPAPLTRLRSGAGLILLIGALGLAFAAVIGAAIAAVGAALDGFVN